jgi:2-polyprenyl-3-methyl-5-hydroxy-6-metoxy-1,4-benzoquinol methylase
VKYIDRVLQNWRIAKARPYIRSGARVLDIGSADGVMFQKLGDAIGPSLGIDPTLTASAVLGRHSLVAGFFPDATPAAEPFDAITMLAVLEHFPPEQYANLQRGCRQYLKSGGVLIITVPSPAVDRILSVLKFLRLIDGMSLEEHHGYDVGRTIDLFSGHGFRLVKRTSFQLGLNNLFVFERVGE